LGDVQPLGRTTEVEFFGHGDEVLDEAQIEPLHRQSLLVVRSFPEPWSIGAAY
jgi:hypothetical protein